MLAPSRKCYLLPNTIFYGHEHLLSFSLSELQEVCSVWLWKTYSCTASFLATFLLLHHVVFMSYKKWTAEKPSST